VTAARFLRVRRNPWVTALACVPFALALVAAVVGALSFPPVGILAVHATVLGILANVYAYRKNPWPRRQRVAVEVERDAIVVGEERVPRAHIKKGLISAGGTVTLSRGLGQVPIELTADDDDVSPREAGSELLSALGLSATQAVAQFRGGSLMHQKKWRVVMMIPLLMTAMAGGSMAARAVAMPGLNAVLMPLLVLLFLTAVVWPSRIDVGADGVLLRWLWYERFVPHDQIVRAVCDERGFGNARNAFWKWVNDSPA
jgi:hypothetical protein